jgi:hypothetical protein
MMRCPWCHAVPVGLTWPSREDCARDHKAATLGTCPHCGGPVSAHYSCPCRIERFRQQRGQAEDKRAGPGPMSGKPVQQPDLLVKGVKDAALRKAIDRTAR